MEDGDGEGEKGVHRLRRTWLSWLLAVAVVAAVVVIVGEVMA